MPKLSKMFTKKEIDAFRQDLIDKHGNECAICEKPRSAFKKNFAVDHDHMTGKIRGLLCFRCNKFVLGRQTLESVNKMKAYLEKYGSIDEKK